MRRGGEEKEEGTVAFNTYQIVSRIPLTRASPFCALACSCTSFAMVIF